MNLRLDPILMMVLPKSSFYSLVTEKTCFLGWVRIGLRWLANLDGAMSPCPSYIGNLHITSKNFLKILYLIILQCFLAAAPLLVRLVRQVRPLSYLDIVEYNMVTASTSHLRWCCWYGGFTSLKLSAAPLIWERQSRRGPLCPFIFYTLISNFYIHTCCITLPD